MANNFKKRNDGVQEDERDTGTKVESVIEQRTLRVLAEKVLELFSDPRKVPEEHVLQEKLLRRWKEYGKRGMYVEYCRAIPRHQTSVVKYSRTGSPPYSASKFLLISS